MMKNTHRNRLLVIALIATPLGSAVASDVDLQSIFPATNKAFVIAQGDVACTMQYDDLQ